MALEIDDCRICGNVMAGFRVRLILSVCLQYLLYYMFCATVLARVLAPLGAATSWQRQGAVFRDLTSLDWSVMHLFLKSDL